MGFLLVTLSVVVFLGPGGWCAYIAITGNKGLEQSTAIVQAGLEWFTFGGVARKGFKKPTKIMTNFLRACCGVVAGSMLILFVLMIYILLDVPGSSPSLSLSNRQKIYYDMIATQDQNPYSNNWNQEVKEAASDYYNVPMSTINEIVREGARGGWLQPDPP